MNEKKVLIIVAHPDDETLWAGGTILSHPSWNWFIVSLCRGSDTLRAPLFFKALEILESNGTIGDLNDGPEQAPLNKVEIERTILELAPLKQYDLIITHNPTGEYTRHIRHEETSRAVINLWHAGKLISDVLWCFAYDDNNKEYYPRAVEKAPICRTLSKRIWYRKYSIITEIYGFNQNSWEAETTPKSESFWQFTDPDDAKKWIKQCNNALLKKIT